MPSGSVGKIRTWLLSWMRFGGPPSASTHALEPKAGGPVPTCSGLSLATTPLGGRGVDPLPRVNGSPVFVESFLERTSVHQPDKSRSNLLATFSSSPIGEVRNAVVSEPVEKESRSDG